MSLLGDRELTLISLSLLWSVFWSWHYVNRIVSNQGVWELPPLWARVLGCGPVIFSLCILAVPNWLNSQLWSPTKAEMILGCIATAVALSLALYASIVLKQGLSTYRPDCAQIPIVAIGPYGVIRHPIYVLIPIAAFSSALAIGNFHSLLAALAVALCYAGVAYWEEQHLSSKYGRLHASYRSHVPMLIPRLKPRKSASATAQSAPSLGRSLFRTKRAPQDGKLSVTPQPDRR